MPFDIYVSGAIASELDDKLRGGKIERIYQPAKDTVLLFVNVPPSPKRGRGREKHSLLISSNSNQARIHTTSLPADNPVSPPAFCMLLRKYLLGGHINSISRHENERIIKIEIVSQNDLGISNSLVLLAELMGRHSNIILLGDVIPTPNVIPTKVGISSLKIIDAIKRVYPEMSAVRQILPGIPYTLPPQNVGLAPVVESEIEGGVSRDTLDKWASEGKYSPSIWVDESSGKLRDFHVFDLSVYRDLKKESFDDTDSMLQSWFARRDVYSRLTVKSADLSQAINTRLSKALLKRQRLEEDLVKAADADSYRLKGELLTANLYKIAKGAAEITLDDYTAEPKKDGTLATLTIKLDTMLTPSQNAQKFFKKYNKAKTAQTEKLKQKAINDEEIAFLESYQVYIEQAQTPDDINELRDELIELGYIRRRKNQARRGSPLSTDLTFDLDDGLSLWVGRNNLENDKLTMKKAKKTDLWLHTKDIPGSHVILSGYKGEGGEAALSDPIVRRAAAVAAFYSKARGSEAVPVDFTLIKYVKKPNGAKPGMVIFTHNKTLYVDPQDPCHPRV